MTVYLHFRSTICILGVLFAYSVGEWWMSLSKASNTHTQGEIPRTLSSWRRGGSPDTSFDFLQSCSCRCVYCYLSGCLLPEELLCLCMVSLWTTLAIPTCFVCTLHLLALYMWYYCDLNRLWVLLVTNMRHTCVWLAAAGGKREGLHLKCWKCNKCCHWTDQHMNVIMESTWAHECVYRTCAICIHDLASVPTLIYLYSMYAVVMHW